MPGAGKGPEGFPTRGGAVCGRDVSVTRREDGKTGECKHPSRGTLGRNRCPGDFVERGSLGRKEDRLSKVTGSSSFTR